MANTFVALATVTVGSGGAANIEFTSIPGTYTDLLIMASMRGTAAATVVQGKIKFNGSTTSYSERLLQGNGSSASSSSQSGADLEWIGVSPGANATASTFGNTFFYIPNYTSSNYKSTSSESVTENNATSATQHLVAGLWSNTSAITQITITPSSGNWAQYSTATLYGIKNS
jgi:hypothetical protein